jgi:hypothetical protein
VQAQPVPTAAPREALLRRSGEERPDPEPAILDRAREMLQSGNLPATLALIAEHARLFPGTRDDARRAGLWSKVCTHYRAAPDRREVAELEARCAAR